MHGLVIPIPYCGIYHVISNEMECTDCRSYIQKEVDRRAELEFTEQVPALDVDHNAKLAEFGR